VGSKSVMPDFLQGWLLAYRYRRGGVAAIRLVPCDHAVKTPSP
jgi:hypothetical protein